MFWDLTHHVLRVAFDFILFSFLFVWFKFVSGQGFLKWQKYSVSHGLRANLSFSSGLWLFGLHVGSNWNLSDGQKKKFFDLVCMCQVSFINLRSKMGKRTMNKSLFYYFFSIKLCLCDKVNFGLVKDSICCNDISDLSKFIIKQTYIISFNTFFFD